MKKIFNLKNIIVTKKYKLNLLKKFLSNIKENEFKVNKSIKNIPWKFLKIKKFKFYFIYFNDEIIGNITILDNLFNRHLYFLYINKDYRNKGIGNFLIKTKFIRGKKLKTVHVLKSLNKTLKFYKKFSFIKSKQNESKNVLKWIAKCTKYDKNTFKDKHLIIKDFEAN